MTTHLSTINSHFGFKNFQLEDYARGALHDGLVLGHDTGGGKSLALFTWPALKVGFQGGQSSSDFDPDEPRALHPLDPVLLVVRGDLHHKTIAGPPSTRLLVLWSLHQRLATCGKTKKTPREGTRLTGHPSKLLILQARCPHRAITATGPHGNAVQLISKSSFLGVWSGAGLAGDGLQPDPEDLGLGDELINIQGNTMRHAVRERHGKFLVPFRPAHGP